jgi:hypothetical protein
MLLLIASVVALLLGIAVMPWRAWQPLNEFSAGLVVAAVAGCTFMGLGFGGAILGAIILFIW